MAQEKLVYKLITPKNFKFKETLVQDQDCFTEVEMNSEQQNNKKSVEVLKSKPKRVFKNKMLTLLH